MVTEGVATKFVPVIVTLVPPAVEPVFGVTAVTVGAGGAVVYVNPLARVAVWKSGFMTTTSTAPALEAEGVVTVSCVALLNVTEAATFELGVPKTLLDGSSTKATVAPFTKFVPVMVSDRAARERAGGGRDVRDRRRRGNDPAGEGVQAGRVRHLGQDRIDAVRVRGVVGDGPRVEDEVARAATDRRGSSSSACRSSSRR